MSLIWLKHSFSRNFCVDCHRPVARLGYPLRLAIPIWIIIVFLVGVCYCRWLLGVRAEQIWFMQIECASCSFFFSLAPLAIHMIFGLAKLWVCVCVCMLSARIRATRSSNAPCSVLCARCCCVWFFMCCVCVWYDEGYRDWPFISTSVRQVKYLVRKYLFASDFVVHIRHSAVVLN